MFCIDVTLILQDLQCFAYSLSAHLKLSRQFIFRGQFFSRFDVSGNDLFSQIFHNIVIFQFFIHKAVLLRNFQKSLSFSVNFSDIMSIYVTKK